MSMRRTTPYLAALAAAGPVASLLIAADRVSTPSRPGPVVDRVTPPTPPQLGISAERQVQIRSIDFDDGIIELFNFGPGDVDLSRWRFCTHDFDQNLRYTGANGLNGNTIESGTSFFVHFNNDAPGGDPDRINRSTLGSFATPLDRDAYGMQLFFPDGAGNISFGNSSLIADHLQWNIDGSGTGSSEQRTAQAVGQGLWTAIGDFISTDADSVRLDLTDLSGDEAGGPSEYSVTGPPFYDESIDGDLSDDPDAPTALAFPTGASTVTGTVEQSGAPSGDRDYITFTVPPTLELAELNLLAYAPDNIGFAAFTAGPTSVIPGFDTNDVFIAGIHIDASDIGTNLLPRFDTDVVTTNDLPEPVLGPGTYTLVIQQTSAILQDYSVEFVLASDTCVADIAPPFGVVDVDDLLGVINNWGLCGPECPGDLAMPFGVVDTEDLLAVINGFGTCPAP